MSEELEQRVARGPRRWREQRWLIDAAIRSDGVEWDQSRLAYTCGPIGGAGASGDAMLIRSRVRKLDDFTPVVSSVAARRESQAREAERAGHSETAAENWFAAALFWGLASWPIWERNDQLIDLDHRKNDAYLRWAALAPHHVELVEIPFDGGLLPAWLHLPPSFDGTPLPTVLTCGGMDGHRETCVARIGDELLARNFAVLAFDGPGQGESVGRGIHVTPTNWIDAGRELIAWASGRPEVDETRLVVRGTSFGGHWITQIAATQPSLLGCSASLPLFEPGARTAFELASPTFKARHMFMAGLFDDEDAFDKLAAGYDLRGLIGQMAVPWMVVSGGADELSPVKWVYELARRCPAPSSLLIYEGGRHGLQETLAPLLGPSWPNSVADWLLDRINGVPASSELRYVAADGSVTERPHPRIAAE
jgi:pimeloyl-ACP methyl ester carboxylesterase